MQITKQSQPLPRLRGLPQIELNYEVPHHKELPHVFKFSGGRSSSMLLLALLKSRQLRPSRGDVVVFNNTSTEYPATYEFVTTCKRIVEQRYNIPFFWLEFQTYEDARRGQWSRLPTFRLVHPVPYSKSKPNGYRHKGEVFEELVSWKQQLPNRFTRLCTQHLKLETTANFLGEWLAVKSQTHRLGHWYDKTKVKAVDQSERAKLQEYLLSQPPTRSRQKFQDYTSAKLVRISKKRLAEYCLDETATLKGLNPVEFISIIGLRGDEPRRVARVKERNRSFANSSDLPDRLADGEHVYMPLFDAEIDRNDVLKFWSKQTWDLNTPHSLNLSNCVYCFMKGKQTLSLLASRECSTKNNSAQYGPEHIEWWSDIENRYSRQMASKRKNGAITRFGFFGADAPVSYAQIQKEARINSDIALDSDSLPCECTD